MRRYLAAGLLACALVPAAWAWGRRAPTPQQPAAPEAQGRPPSQPALPEPEYLSPLARALLHGRMVRHGELMGELARAVVLLQYPRVAALARDVADEPQLGQAGTREPDALEAELSPDFFTFEAALRAHAQQLGEAARAKDAAALGAHFGELARTCVSCHAAYRTPPAP